MAEKRVIAIDGDDTLFPTAEPIHKKYGLWVHSPELLERYQTKNGDDDIGPYLANLLDVAIVETEPLPGSQEAVKEMAEQDELYLVTGRPRETDGALRDYLGDNFGGETFKDILYTDRFNPDLPNKRLICTLLGAAALIDDTPGQYIAPPTTQILFGENDWTVHDGSPNMVVAKNWDQAIVCWRHLGYLGLIRDGIETIQPNGR